MTSTTDKAKRMLFLGTHGHVIALEKQTGETLWSVSLDKTGYDVVSIVYEDDTLFCASGGHAFALDPETGDTLWTNDLPGMGYGLVFLTTVASHGLEAAMAALAAARDSDASDTTATS